MHDPLSRTYAAIAHPTRRAILEQVRGRLTRMSDLAATFDVSFNTVSKHVRVLEGAGLLRRHVHGRTHFRTARAAPLSAAAVWIDEYRGFWRRQKEALGALTGGDPGP